MLSSHSHIWMTMGEIEPNYYMPTLPMILINGSEGQTDFLVLFRHSIRLISKTISSSSGQKPIVPMKPWYRGFKGAITRESNEGAWIAEGIWKDMGSKKN